MKRIALAILTTSIIALGVISVLMIPGYMEINKVTPFAYSNTNVGYVKYTLILYDNTLLKGNVISTKSDLGPFGIIYANGRIYVADSGSDTISVINSTTNHVIGNITVKGHPFSLLYDPSNGYIYVTSPLHLLFVINPSTGEVIHNISLFPPPVLDSMAYDPSNGYIYVISCTVVFPLFVINSSTNKVIHEIELGKFPHFVSPLSILYDPSNGYLYVTNYRNTVLVINTSTDKVIANISVGQYPLSLAYDPSNGYVYVTDAMSNTISVINSNNTVVANISVGKWPSSIVYDPSNGYIYVIDTKSNMVSVIDPSTNQVIANITVGKGPSDIVYDPNNGYMYVTNCLSGSISIIATEQATHTSLPLYIMISLIIAAAAVIVVSVVLIKKRQS
ncbi:YncE family protein [Acidianus sp. HS-5]|uniref:YncE family protein n=1 Tax=Acidianus sp. HS-5 TaxID=2886040 RepID=UPI001F2735C1|nr:YncE family protein [Acidianus sp. HS-5]BDC18779.1 hypothetical protein HS5_16690 [Acidianus sp. HS-5]